MSLSKVRAFFYKAGRLLGDISAVQQGRVEKRIERRVVGRFTARILGKLFR